MNSENMSNHFSTKKFGKFQCKLRACGRDDLFFGLHMLLGGKWTSADVMTFFLFLVFTCFWAEKWTSAGVMTFFLVFTCFWAEKRTSADVMTLKEPVLLLRSENSVTLTLKCFVGGWCCSPGNGILPHPPSTRVLANNIQVG